MLNSTPSILQDSPATGSHDDIYLRLLQQLPPWWGTTHENLDTTLEAYITTAVFHYSQFQYIVLQMRLQTATDINLDQISQDYLGDSLPRREGESDDNYRKRISAVLLQEKATRNGISNALYTLTGNQPRMFEPWNPKDVGSCNVDAYCDIAYCGSGSYPYQGFIDVYVDDFVGMANYAGCDGDYMYCNAINSWPVNYCGGTSEEFETVTDDDINLTVLLTKVEGTLVWVRINRI